MHTYAVLMQFYCEEESDATIENMISLGIWRMKMIALYIIIALIIIIAIWAITAYNGLVRLRNKADEAEAGVDAHLKQRYDLVPNLVETVKGYASHEKSTLDAVIEARNRTVSVKSLQERAKAEAGLTAALDRLFALAESYPDLKANQNFVSLQNELSGIEEGILNARKYYNAVARSFNDKVMVFPSSIIASAFHFDKRDYIEAEEAERARVDVRF